ncbi:MAG TPA: protein kinase [Gemmataceae bacterium]|nr:protein kinase [Gemmataceae bacterium]
MSIASATVLIELLRRHRLLNAQQLASLPAVRSGHGQDPRTLAKTLVQHGWLTVYQMNQLFAGHANELVLGPYHILDRLGQGGQSLVFKARHSETSLAVALKVIRSELLETADARQQFLQEMEAMAELDHPNIVQFCDADQAGDTFYCAMEYIEGTDLGKYVRLTGMLPPVQAADYIRQTALGLQHAHERNLIHRDIKPVNLFLTSEQGQARPALESPRAAARGLGALIKILDWGLACLRPTRARGNAADQSNSGGAIIGTADYLSPEQARNANIADIRSDIYSLGCTFYYLLTGQPPFPGGTLVEKLMHHSTAEPKPVESLNPEVTPALTAVLKRMLAKKPEERYQTPAAVAMALASFCRRPHAKLETPRRETRPAVASEPTRIQDDTPMPASLRGERTPKTTPAPVRAPHPPRVDSRRP